MLGSEIRFPLQQQRENQSGSPFVVDAGHARGLSARPQGALFRGRGCRQRIAAVTRAKRECESRFPLQRGKSGKRKENRKILLFVFRGGDGIRRPRPQGAPFRGRGCQQRIAAVTRAMCESRFPLQKKGKNLATLPFLFCLHGTGACAVSGFRMLIQARCSRLYCRPAGDLS